MSASTIAGRYAKSLLELAVEQGKLDTIYQDIQGFKSSLESRDLVLLLKSPIVNASKKLSSLKAVFEPHFDDLTMRFLGIVTKKGREAFLPEIANAFIDQYRAHNNIASAKLITASKLTAEKLEAIKASINNYSNATKIEIEEHIDESLIGGFVIEMGDKRYDASVKHKLDKLRKSFS